MELGNTSIDSKIQTAPPTKVGKTWFLERENGQIIAVSEVEAHALTHPTQMNAKRYKIVGTSDGKTYVSVIKNAGKDKIELENKVRTMSSDITRYLNTLDKFKFEELLEESSPKVKRVRKIIDALQTDIDKTKEGLANIQKLVVDKAFNAELEVARNNIELPKNCDVFTPNGNKEKIYRALNI